MRQVESGNTLSFDHADGSCTLYRQPLARMVNQLIFTSNGSSTKVFYRQYCFHCFHECPTKFGTNLFTNPGFEAPLQPKSISPWHDNSPIYNETAMAKLGSPGYKSSTAVVSLHAVSVFQTFTLCKNQIYTLSFYLKVQFANALASVEITADGGDSSSNVFFPRGSLPNDTWVLHRSTMGVLSYFPGADARFYAVLQSSEDESAGTTYWLDAFDVSPHRDSLLPRTGAPELVTNGGFESGKTAPFAVRTFTGRNREVSIVSPGYNGSSHALLFSPRRPKDSPVYSATLTQNIATQSGKSYIVGFVFLLRNGDGVTPNTTCPLDIGPQPLEIIFSANGDTSGTAARSADFFAPTLRADAYGVWTRYARLINGLHYGSDNQLSFSLAFRTNRGCPIMVDDISVKEAR